MGKVEDFESELHDWTNYSGSALSPIAASGNGVYWNSCSGYGFEWTGLSLALSAVFDLTAFPQIQELSKALRARGITVACAESCTGGLLGAVLTELPGSSDYFAGGIIAYSNQIKVDVLGIDSEILESVGAVSSECAVAMAQRVARVFSADIGIATTGMAGPARPEDTKPAGLIFVAVAMGNSIEVSELDGDRGRELNRAGAVGAALQLCWSMLQQAK